MHYSDETRRYNFVTGLALGAVLGAGLALVLKPQQRGRAGARLRETLAGGIDAGRVRIGR